MLRPRVIPCLLLDGKSLVKTTQFAHPDYIGDPVNTIRIFNELEVDELMLLDISASKEERSPQIDLLKTLVDECFMPISYGGGIQDLDTARELFSIGIEKVVINSHTFDDPSIINSISDSFGSQSVIGSIDVKNKSFGGRKVYSQSGSKEHNVDPVEWAKELERRGVGELLITSIDREGTWEGFDHELINDLSSEVSVPIIAHGGASDVSDIRKVIHQSGASAAAVGSMVVYQKQDKGVLVNFPDIDDLRFKDPS
jgi:cyclase